MTVRPNVLPAALSFGQWLSDNVSCVHEAPEPGDSPAQGFPRPSPIYPFTARAASGAERRAA